MFESLCLWSTWALSLFIVLACICRIAALEPDNHRLMWRIMYILFAAAALEVAFNARELLELSDWMPFFIVAGFAVNLLLTRHSWTNGAAEITKLKGTT
jgi:hypothetical protein